MDDRDLQPAATPIVGSAEPLTREQTLIRLRELEAWGVDLSLIRDSLGYTPSERVARMFSVLRLATALQQAMRSHWEQATSSPATTDSSRL
jgi:hypothetical protein